MSQREPGDRPRCSSGLHRWVPLAHCFLRNLRTPQQRREPLPLAGTIPASNLGFIDGSVFHDALTDTQSEFGASPQATTTA
jgi:hypothetical protein